jgi:hypothetical protein
MEWEIIPFIGMGPIKFEMSPSEVAAVIGLPDSREVDEMYLREYRATNLPIVSYENDRVLRSSHSTTLRMSNSVKRIYLTSRVFQFSHSWKRRMEVSE